MKKRGFIAIVAAIVLMSGMTVYAAPETMADGTVFDAEYYAQENPDVVKICGNSVEALYKHYIEHGKDEGRKPCASDETASKSKAKVTNSKTTSSKTTNSKAKEAVSEKTTADTSNAGTQSGSLVWIPTKGGKKYHSNSSCSGMDGPRQVTVEEAKKLGFDRCKKCKF